MDEEAGDSERTRLAICWCNVGPDDVLECFKLKTFPFETLYARVTNTMWVLYRAAPFEMEPAQPLS